MKILLAEDDPHISVIMQLCLERIGGHSVVICEDGEKALQTAIQDGFDLILLDGMMPKRNGLQVAKELRDLQKQNRWLHPTPIIFLSAKSDDVPGFLSLGQGYISKPFDPQTICTLIDDILRQSGAAAG